MKCIHGVRSDCMKAARTYQYENYFEPLLAMFDKMISEEYLDEKYMKQLFMGEDFSSLVNQFKDFEPVEVRTYKDLQKGIAHNLKRCLFLTSVLYTTWVLSECPSIMRGCSKDCTFCIPNFNMMLIEG